MISRTFESSVSISYGDAIDLCFSPVMNELVRNQFEN